MNSADIKFRIILILSIILLLIFMVGCGDGNNQSNTGDTPEDAIKEFFTSVNESDYNKMISSYPYEKIVHNYNYDKLNEWIQRIEPKQYSKAEKKELRQEDLERFNAQVNFLLLEFIGEDQFSIIDDEIVLNPIETSTKEKLRKVKLVTIDTPKSLGEIQATDDYKKNIQKIVDAYGAQDVTERIALINYQEKNFIVGFRLIKYNGKWWIESLRSDFAELNTIGLEEISATEYHSLIY